MLTINKNYASGHPEVKFDFAKIKESVPLATYCGTNGIQLRPHGDYLTGKCPIHNEHHGQSFVVWPDEGKWKCFGKCDRSGDIIDLEQALSGGTVKDAVERLGGELVREIRMPAPKGASTPTPVITEDNPLGLPYWLGEDERRISTDCAERLFHSDWAIQSIADQRGWKPETIRNLILEPSLGITEDNKLAFLYESGLKVRWRSNGERLFRWLFGKSWFWRGSYIPQAATVWITEGETDAIWLVDQGFEDSDTTVVALPSAAFALNPWRALFAGKKIVLCSDDDEAGSKSLERVKSALRGVANEIDFVDWQVIRNAA
jgi:hypothetical protein